MKKKSSLIILIALLVSIPLFAVFNEKDLPQTLSVLRYELNQEYVKMGNRQGRIDSRNRQQHDRITDMVKKCNELALILYSQNPDCTFDVTYALREVTDEYETFNRNKVPYEDLLHRFDLEIEKYENLIKALKRIPPIIRDEADSLSMIMAVSDSVRAVTDSIRATINHSSALLPERISPADMSPEMRDSIMRSRSLFALDTLGVRDRDSCLFYAEALLDMYNAAKVRTMLDNEHYENASSRLQESYDYAQSRYKEIQHKIFVDGQDNYFKILASLPTYVNRAFQDASQKYNNTFDFDQESIVSHSEWRGPIVFGFVGIVFAFILVAALLTVIAVTVLKKSVKYFRTEDFHKKTPCLAFLCAFVLFGIFLFIGMYTLNHNFFRLACKLLLAFAGFVAAILLSMLIRMKPDHIRFGMWLYLPVVLLGFIVIFFRIIFVPNTLVNLILPPLLVVFFFWQLSLCIKGRGRVETADEVFAWISLIVLAVTVIMSFAGYVLLSVVVLMWWLFQFAAIQVIVASITLLEKYYDRFLSDRLKELRKNRRSDFSNKNKGFYIQVTWLYDLVEMVAVPVVAVMSLPISIFIAAGIFDLTDACVQFFYKDIVELFDTNGKIFLQLSLYKVVLVVGLYFIFKYVSYAVRSFYRMFRFSRTRKKSGKDYIHANQVNLTLANNVVSILTWGTYIITCIVLLKIPMGAISIVAAGLATGLGLALKDVLNNFIYGIQLMSGRLRVGDYIECDGIRGRVERISYQSTEIETIGGAIMAITNTTLFNKNFINLTKNNSYEFLKVEVGVSYGTDIEHARQVILKAFEALQSQDKYGRDVVDPKRGVSVSFDSFGDSSVNLAVKQFVLVEEKASYLAKAKETIYNALNGAGIEIPFPQRDVSVKITKEDA